MGQPGETGRAGRWERARRAVAPGQVDLTVRDRIGRRRASRRRGRPPRSAGRTAHAGGLCEEWSSSMPPPAVMAPGAVSAAMTFAAVRPAAVISEPHGAEDRTGVIGSTVVARRVVARRGIGWRLGGGDDAHWRARVITLRHWLGGRCGCCRRSVCPRCWRSPRDDRARGVTRRHVVGKLGLLGREARAGA